MCRVVAFEKREIGDRYHKVYDKCFENETTAQLVAEEIAKRISDINGFSYVKILDEYDELIDCVRGIYSADSNPNLSEFNEEEFLNVRG